MSRRPSRIIVLRPNGEVKFYATFQQAQQLVDGGNANWETYNCCRVIRDWDGPNKPKSMSSLSVLFKASGTSASRGLLISYDRRVNADLREKRLSNADGFHTEQQWLSRVALYGWRCKYCGIELDKRTLTKDHQVAIVNGGTEWPSNLVPSCKPCNSWKGARSVKVLN